MTQRLSALIIAQAFPPQAAVGVHRTIGLCKCLARRGWEVTVVTAAPGQGTALDAELLAAVPEKVRVVRTPAPDLPVIAARMLKRRKSLSSTQEDCPPSGNGATSKSDWRRRSRVELLVDWLSWWLHVPDGCTGWFVPAVWAGMRAGIRSRPTVIFSSAPVWTGHVAAAVISRALRVPLVADFRDPWCGSAFHKIPYSAHRWFDSLLEKFVMKTARKTTCAWDGIRRHLAERYPERVTDISTILNGFDPDFMDAVAPVRLDSQKRVFLYTGSFYGPRSPLPLFAAAQQLRHNTHIAGGIVFVLVGSASYGGRSFAALMRDYGVQDMFLILPQVSHRKAISLLKGADVAMLFGQSGNESLASIPGKAYEYIGAHKPVLSIGAGEEVCRVMREGGCRVWEASADRPTEIASVLTNITDSLAQDGPVTCADTTARERFTRARMSVDLERVLRVAMLRPKEDRKPKCR